MTSAPFFSSKSMHFSASIVIPVWNRLERLGECLASLATHTPEAQFILMDLGSERETERRLEQFAEVLEERVLLMHEPLNRGKTAAINRGIASAAAESVVVLSPLSTVTAGWMTPLLSVFQDHSDVGIVCPAIGDAGTKKRPMPPTQRYTEVSQGSFYCQAIRRDLFSLTGPFDETLDGLTWCLQDFSRRAWRAGFRTAQCGESLVYATPELLFGSHERRNQTDAESCRLYGERWGKPATYCLCLADVAPWWPIILAGARQGDTYAIVTPYATSSCFQGDVRHAHAAISWTSLPRFFPERRGKQIIAKLLAANPEIQLVTDQALSFLPTDGTVWPMAQMTKLIAKREQSLYGRNITTEVDHAE